MVFTADTCLWSVQRWGVDCWGDNKRLLERQQSNILRVQQMAELPRKVQGALGGWSQVVSKGQIVPAFREISPRKNHVTTASSPGVSGSPCTRGLRWQNGLLSQTIFNHAQHFVNHTTHPRLSPPRSVFPLETSRTEHRNSRKWLPIVLVCTSQQ